MADLAVAMLRKAVAVTDAGPYAKLYRLVLQVRDSELDCAAKVVAYPERVRPAYGLLLKVRRRRPGRPDKEVRRII